MKKLLFMLLAALYFSAGPLQGQDFVRGNLTAASTDCADTTLCVTLNLPSGSGSAKIVLGGTFVGTLQFEATVGPTADDTVNWSSINGDPLTTGVAVSSSTASGTWGFNVSGLQRIRVRPSAYTSGTVRVRINASPAAADSRGGGGTGAVVHNIRFCEGFAGADAGARITACIANLPATGGTADARGLEGPQTITTALAIGTASTPVHLLCGASTFTFSATITIQAQSGISGMHGCTFRQANAANLGVGISMEGNEAFVDGITYDGNKANQTSGSGVGLNPTSPTTIDRVRITNNVIRDTYGSGIYLFHTREANVSNNWFSGNTHSITDAVGAIAMADNARDVIRGNHIRDTSGHGIIGSSSTASVGIIIDNNTILNVPGIGIAAGSSFQSGFIISNNYINTPGSGGSQNGIDMANSTGMKVHGNTVISATLNGIAWDAGVGQAVTSNSNNEVTANTISLSGEAGINFSNTGGINNTAFAAGNLIANNVVFRNAIDGIVCWDCQDTVIDSNVVHDNNTSDNANGQGIHIFKNALTVLTGISITNNRVYERLAGAHQKYSIRLQGVAADFADIIIANNNLTPYETGAILAPTFATLYKWGNEETAGQLDTGGSGLGPINAFLNNATLAGNLTMTAGLLDLTAGNFQPPASAGCIPTATNQFCLDSTTGNFDYWDLSTGAVESIPKASAIYSTFTDDTHPVGNGSALAAVTLANGVLNYATDTNAYSAAGVAQGVGVPTTTAAQTGTYQIVAGDFPAAGCGYIPVTSGTFTMTLVASGSQPANGRCATILNYGTGVVTLARSGQNINGAAANLTGTAGSATAPTGWQCVSDGTNYICEVMGAAGAPTDAQYVTLATNATLTAERVLTQGTGVSVTDAGAGSTVTVANTGHVRLFDKRPTLILPSAAFGGGLTNLGDTPTGTVGTASSIAPDASDGLATDYATAATLNDNAGAVGQAGIYRVGRNMDMQFAASQEQTTVIRFWIALTDQSIGTMLAADDPAGNYAGFQYCNDGAGVACAADRTNWFACTKDNTTQGCTDTTVAADGAAHEFQIVDNGANWTFYIDGTLRATRTTNLPLAGTNLGIIWGVRTLEAVAKNFRLYGIDLKIDE